VILTSRDGQHVFLQGSTGGNQGNAADTTGNAPAAADSNAIARVWVDRVELQTGKRDRLYESAGDVGETISTPLDPDFTKALVQRESKTVVGQSYILDLSSKSAKQITRNRDLMPDITNAMRKVVWARRADGHTFKINVTLPRDYREGTRLPALFWFYPSEFESQAAYDRGQNGRGGAPPRYPSYGPRTIEFLVAEGYAVIQPDAPIFAENSQPPNDHYVDDLRDDLAATIDALDTLAIIDRQRLAIGGHSYGAFSTANAMVHTPFFKAGIAGDGNYNRTLTPNGFQNERRDLWQGRDVYLAMSPFLYADRLNGALLMYHSEEDQNVGTDPVNSIKMFHALMGLGKTVSLYMYPYEDHGPVARETVLDQWARWVAWLDKYVKQANKPPAETKAILPEPASH
jgi:dipeptidyl aminopeptidase/acylaminoacyl peptidase